MKYLSDDVIGNLEEMVTHLSKRCELFVQSRSYFSQTEVGATIHNILLSIRRLQYIIDQIGDKQKKTLLKVVNFNLDFVLQAFGHISSDLKLALKSEVEDKDETVFDDLKEMVKTENESPIFTFRDRDEEYGNARCVLMSRIKENYLEAQNRIEQINNLIDDIEKQELELKRNERLQKDLYNLMLDNYRKNEWSSDFVSFVKQINRVIKKRKNILGILESELDNLCNRHLNSYKPSPVERLYNSVIDDGKAPYEIIKEYRTKLTTEEISDYFAFQHKYSTLKEHIDSIPLLEEVDGPYKKLFVNRAAKAYVDLLRPPLSLHCEINEKGHFPILLMALRDLGLSPTENKNKPYVQMKDYANEMNIDEGLRFERDYSIFSKMFGWLGDDNSFCELEWGNVGNTQFTEDNILEYQDVYWRCFTILNQRGLRMPNEIKVASYLKNPHPALSMDVVMDNYTPEQLIRLYFLRSTIRRETLVFG